MSSQQEVAHGIPPSTGYGDFRNLVGWEPEDPAGFVVESTRYLVPYIKELSYSQKCNLKDVFREAERSLHSDEADAKSVKEQEFWRPIEEANITSAFGVFLSRHLPSTILVSKKVIALLMDEQVQATIIARSGARIATGILAKDVFYTALRQAFAKDWSTGYKLLSNIYLPLINKIDNIISNNDLIKLLGPDLRGERTLLAAVSIESAY